jgi:NAD(P)H-hydrate epimerase
MLARNRDALESAVISAYFNGIAGKMIQKKLGYHMTATDLLDVLPSVMKSFDKIK